MGWLQYKMDCAQRGDITGCGNSEKKRLNQRYYNVYERNYEDDKSHNSRESERCNRKACDSLNCIFEQT